MGKRPLTAFPLDGLDISVPSGPLPQLTWVDPATLLVDESYQRGIGVRGTRLIRKILTDFDWRKFKPPTVVATAEGLEVIDGQHSAIAALSNPHVGEIPVLLVEAPGVGARASAFIGINRDRLNVSPVQLHAAGLMSDDGAALEVQAICDAAGLRILATPRPRDAYSPGETVAVRAIRDLIKRRGPERARLVLTTSAEAELAPVTAADIKAIDFLLHDPDHEAECDAESLASVIKALAGRAAKEGAIFAAEHKVSIWRALAAVWYRGVKARRAKSEKPPQRRVIQMHRSVPTFGDPPAGRSALDQRKA